MAPLVAGVFAARGKDTAVFRGDDGLDELTVSTTSRVWWVRDGARHSSGSWTRSGSGWPSAPLSALRGGVPAHNAQVVRDVFAGAPGPVRDAVVLNAGIALARHGPRIPVATRRLFEADAARRAWTAPSRCIDSGAARPLEQWSDVTARVPRRADRSRPRSVAARC